MQTGHKNAHFDTPVEKNLLQCWMFQRWIVVVTTNKVTSEGGSGFPLGLVAEGEDRLDGAEVFLGIDSDGVVGSCLDEDVDAVFEKAKLFEPLD